MLAESRSAALHARLLLALLLAPALLWLVGLIVLPHVELALLSLRERDVALMTRTSVTAMERDASRAVSSLVLEQDGQTRRVRVRGGVILASGGFNRHPQRRAETRRGSGWAVV